MDKFKQCGGVDTYAQFGEVDTLKQQGEADTFEKGGGGDTFYDGEGAETFEDCGEADTWGRARGLGLSYYIKQNATSLYSQWTHNSYPAPIQSNPCPTQLLS